MLRRRLHLARGRAELRPVRERLPGGAALSRRTVRLPERRAVVLRPVLPGERLLQRVLPDVPVLQRPARLRGHGRGLLRRARLLRRRLLPGGLRLLRRDLLQQDVLPGLPPQLRDRDLLRGGRDVLRVRLREPPHEPRPLRQLLQPLSRRPELLRRRVLRPRHRSEALWDVRGHVPSRARMRERPVRMSRRRRRLQHRLLPRDGLLRAGAGVLRPRVRARRGVPLPRRVRAAAGLSRGRSLLARTQ